MKRPHRTEELWAAYSESRTIELRNELVEAYLWIVPRIANKLRMRLPKYIALDELTSAGSLGLIRAVERFDPTRNLSFCTFATFSIRGAMLDELRSSDFLTKGMRREFGDECPAKVSLQTVSHEVVRLKDNTIDPPWNGIVTDEFWEMVNSIAGNGHNFVERYYRRSELMPVIGASVGLSKSRVWQILRDAEKRLVDNGCQLA